DNENSSALASQLFRSIAYSVIKSPSNTCIEKDFVISLHGQCKNETRIKVLFKELIEMFGENNEMPVIGNLDLNNRILKNVVTIIASDIPKANETIAESI
ncbi:hypothetical protein EDC94DRAFT_487312, partial [Helicostylum pulchrum]